MALPAQAINHTLTSPTIPTPQAILDRAIVTRNTHAMLNACRALGVGFRAHVKSHKTLELAKLQVSHDPTATAHFVVSTLLEAENLAPYIREQAAFARPCSILYGIPIPPTAIPRLLTLSTTLPPGTLSILLDNASTLSIFQSALQAFLRSPLNPTNFDPQIGVFIKIDTGYQRAGIRTDNPDYEPLARNVAEGSDVGEGGKGKGGFVFRGFYSHYGHSYAGSSADDAAHALLAELKGLREAVRSVPESFRSTIGRKLILSVGATPTATIAQTLATGKLAGAAELRNHLAALKNDYDVEFHAGVYPLLDLQQVATCARPSTGDPEPAFQPLSKENIGLKILVEVTSVYESRGGKPEALISAGSLALGREPCKSYPGWGIVTDELGNADAEGVYTEREDEAGRSGWIVSRVSQEHGVLRWEGDASKCNRLEVGDKLLVWPNHACIASAHFPNYLVVDSDREGEEYTVCDVWQRWRGW